MTTTKTVTMTMTKTVTMTKALREKIKEQSQRFVIAVMRRHDLTKQKGNDKVKDRDKDREDNDQKKYNDKTKTKTMKGLRENLQRSYLKKTFQTLGKRPFIIMTRQSTLESISQFLICFSTN